MKTDWPVVKIGEVCEIVSGGTPKSGIEEYWGGPIGWVTPKDLSALQGAYIGSTPRTLTESGLKNCSAKILPPNSVLFSSRAPIGHVAINTTPMATNQGFKSFLPDSAKVDYKFLYWWLLFRKPQIQRMGTGATFKEISKRVTERIDLVLPPIEEQRRIASILDAADNLRTKRRQALAKLDTLTQAIFIDMFGDLANNPYGWELKAINEFTAEFESGLSVAAGADEIQSDYRVLKISAVTSGTYKSSESKPVPVGHCPKPHHHVKQGDLLFSRANTTELVGACAHVDETPLNHLLPDKLWRFVWSQPRVVEPIYIREALLNRRARNEIGELATGSSGSMKNISQKKFMRMKIPVAPFDRQRQFVKRQSKIQSARQMLHVQGNTSEQLFASLQQKAFRGEL